MEMARVQGQLSNWQSKFAVCSLLSNSIDCTCVLLFINRIVIFSDRHCSIRRVPFSQFDREF